MASGVKVVELAETLIPDMIVLDISLGDVNGFEVAKALRAKGCSAKIVFLSVHQNPEFVRRGFELGAAGYVFKSQMTELAQVIKLVAAGQTYNPLI